jgi:tetratricopeptide (TPR) repeat protein
MSDSQQQELSQLEMAFAADPKAFVALTNAYLQRGRFMEAMVVCKKGIKALPDSVEGRLLLGRVYAEQGKVPKALEEVKALLATNPEHAEAHFVAAQLHERSGRFEEAIEAFKEAIRCDRSHEAAKAALKAKGIDFDPGPSPEELAAQQAALAAEQAQKAAEAAARQAAEEAAARSLQAAQAAKARATGQALDQFGAANARTTSPAVAAAVDPAFAAAYAQNLYGYAGPQAQMAANRRFGPGFTFGFATLLLLIIVGVVVGARNHKQEQDRVKELLIDQQALVKKDTTKGHKKALEKLQDALKIDDDQEIALGQYAYSLALLADRGVKEADDKTVGDAVEQARKKAKDHPLSVAAQMATLRRTGDAAGAEGLARAINADAKLLVPMVRIELGKALLTQGKVREAAGIADTLAETPDVAGFTFAAVAYRAVGETFKARRALDNAIKVELDHDPARALRALFIIEQDDVVSLPVALDDVRSVLDLGKDALGVRQLGYATLGRALLSRRLRAGSDREFSSDLAAARGLLRNDPEMPFFEARIAKDEKRYDDALKLLDEAIKLDPYRIGSYLAVIEVASRAKKFDLADKGYADAQKVFGDNLELGLSKSTRLLAEQRADDALAHLQTMLKTLDLAEVHRDIGKVYMLKRDPQNAVANLKKAAEKASSRGPGTQANIYTWLGRALAQADDHEQAKDAYKQALAVTSDFATTYYWLALSLEALEENDAAKEAFTNYLKAEPNGPYADEAKRHLEGGGEPE